MAKKKLQNLKAGAPAPTAAGKTPQGKGAASGKGAAGPAPVAATANMDVWDRIAWICLHLLVFIVPIAMSNLGPFNAANGAPLTYDQFDIVKVFFQRAFMIVALAAWAIGMLTRGGKVRFTKIEWLILAFFAWVALSAVFSVHVPTAIFGKYRRFEGLISFLTYGATFFVALQYVDRPSRLRSLARTLAVGGFVVAFYGFIQVIGTVDTDFARVLGPIIMVLSVAVAGLAGYIAYSRLGDDPDGRAAMYTIAALAIGFGILLAAGIADNVGSALASSLPETSIDPVNWGQLPFERHRAFSTYGNPDLLGGYMVFSWAIVIGLALSEKHKTWRTMYWIFTFMNAFVGLTSYVRGAWIGATVSLIALVIAYLRARKGSDLRLESVDRFFIGAASVAAVVTVAVTSFSANYVTNVWARVVSIFEFDQGSALTRFQIWEAARAAIAERPILGWGADTFRLVFPMFKPAEYVQAAGYLSVADNVHNYPLQLAAGIGVPGAVMLYALFAWVLYAAASTAFASGKGAERLLFAGFWAAILGYIVHLLFGLSVTGCTVFLWLSMGIVLSPLATTHEIKPVRAAMPLAVAIGVVVLVLSVMNIRYIVADNHFLKAHLVARDAAISELERAIEINPYNDMYRLEIASAWHDIFRSRGQQYQSSGLMDVEQRASVEEAFAAAEQKYREMLEYVPMEYDTYVFMTNFYNEATVFLGDEYAEQAVDIGFKGVEVEPFGPAVRVQLSIALMRQDRIDEAIEQLEVATSLDTRYEAAYAVLGDAYAEAGRYDDARAAYEHALKEEPGTTAAIEGLERLDALEASGSAAATETTP